MTVRRAIPGDAQLWVTAVATIISADEREDELIEVQAAEAALNDPRCYMLLAFEAESPIGLLSAYRFPDVTAGGEIVYLYDIEVLSSSRRQGLGRMLLEELTSLCERDGVKWIWAGTEKDNLPARRAFEATEAELEGDRYVEYEWDLLD